MADKPILFSGPMVRALIAGTKTQTRRELNPQPVQNSAGLWAWSRRGVSVQGDCLTLALAQRIGVGDRLYVRETWSHSGDHVFEIHQARMATQGRVIYRADDDAEFPHAQYWPSIHMPREFSRITLTVTDVRVERLQDISVEDAVAEGALASAEVDQFAQVHAIPMYRAIWTGIDGEGSWEANPWVAAYTFTVQMGNIDQLRAAA